VSNLNNTTLDEHIYRVERHKGCLQVAKGFKWITNGSKELKSKHSTKGASDRLPVAFSAQPLTLNIYNFWNSFPNLLQQVLSESLESLFSNGSSCNGFGATKLLVKTSRLSKLDQILHHSESDPI